MPLFSFHAQHSTKVERIVLSVLLGFELTNEFFLQRISLGRTTWPKPNVIKPCLHWCAKM